MNKQGWLSFVAVLVLSVVMSYVVDGLILGSTYESLKDLWRPDMQSLMWIYYVIMVVGSFLFVFIFARGYEGKGIVEGFRYGLYIGIWMGIGMAYGTYAMIAIPYSLALTWFISTVIQYILAGMLTAAIFGKKAMVTRVAQA
jgi:hypothetical protein